jgi:SPOR domain
VRAVFLILLSANLLFLAWARWIDTPRESATQDALSRLPRLQLVSEAPAGMKPTAGIAQKMALHEAPVQSCTSVGPFNDMASAARTAAMLIDRGFKLRQRAEPGDTLEGYWVFVGGMQTDEDVTEVVNRLEKSGFTDAHVMKLSLEGRRVSVGLFSKRERAERRAKAVQHMGLDPQIVERKFPGTVYWVDVERIPGDRELPAEGLMPEIGQPKVGVLACPPGSEMLPAQPAAPEHGDEGDGLTKSLPRTTVASAPKQN